MPLIVAALLAAFSPPPAVGAPRQETPAPATDTTPDSATPEPSGPLGFDLNLDGWTVREVMDQAEQHRLPLLAVTTFLVLLLLWSADALRPGGLGKGGRDVKSHPSLVWAFAGLLVLSAAVFSGAILKQQQWLTGTDPESLRGLSALSAAIYAVGATVALGMIYLFARSAPKAGLVPGLMDAPIALLCLILAAPIVLLSADLAVLIYEKTMETAVEPIAHPTLTLILNNRNDPWVWGLIAGAVVGAPIVEETIYRVFFQSALLKWIGSPWAAVIGSAGLFTAMHAIGPEPVPPYALVPIAVLGLSMGVAYERTRRLGVPILMHMGFNAANILLAMRIHDQA